MNNIIHLSIHPYVGSEFSYVYVDDAIFCPAYVHVNVFIYIIIITTQDYVICGMREITNIVVIIVIIIHLIGIHDTTFVPFGDYLFNDGPSDMGMCRSLINASVVGGNVWSVRTLHLTFHTRTATSFISTLESLRSSSSRECQHPTISLSLFCLYSPLYCV